MQFSRDVGKKRKGEGREEGWGGEGKKEKREEGSGGERREGKKRSIDSGIDGKEQIHEKTLNHQ